MHLFLCMFLIVYPSIALPSLIPVSSIWPSLLSFILLPFIFAILLYLPLLFLSCYCCIPFGYLLSNVFFTKMVIYCITVYLILLHIFFLFALLIITCFIEGFFALYLSVYMFVPLFACLYVCSSVCLYLALPPFHSSLSHIHTHPLWTLTPHTHTRTWDRPPPLHHQLTPDPACDQQINALQMLTSPPATTTTSPCTSSNSWFHPKGHLWFTIAPTYPQIRLPPSLSPYL